MNGTYKLTASDKRALDNEINKINKGLEKLQTNGMSNTSVRKLITETIGYNIDIRVNPRGQAIISRSVKNKQLLDYSHRMNQDGSKELHNIVSSININTSGKGNNKSLDLYKALEDIKRKNEQSGIKQPVVSKGNILKKMSTSNIQMTFINSATNESLFDSDEDYTPENPYLDDDEDFRSNTSNKDITKQRELSDQSTFQTMTGKMRKGFKILGEHFTPYGDKGFVKDATGEFFDNFGDVLRFMN